jgi:anti-anti-sigma factor
MQITVTEDTGGKTPVTIFHITGDLDVQTSAEFEAKATEANRNGTTRLLVDLTGVRYVSSAGLRSIHSVFNLLRARNPQENDEVIQKGLRDATFKSSLLKIVCPDEQVRQVFTLSGYDMFLEIHKDLQEAIRSFY